VPAAVLVSRQQWLDAASPGHPEPAAAAPAVAAPTLAAATDGGANTGAIAVPALPVKPPRAAAMPASGAQRTRNLRAPLLAGLAAGLVAGLALGAAFFVLLASPTVAPQASLQLPNARPGDVPRAAANIRDQSGESAPPAFDPNSLPPPQGTMRRLEGISKSFLNR
jgi:hypothetical protein